MSEHLVLYVLEHVEQNEGGEVLGVYRQVDQAMGAAGEAWRASSFHSRPVTTGPPWEVSGDRDGGRAWFTSVIGCDYWRVSEWVVR